MRSNYPISSLELRDRLLSCYEKCVHLIGRVDNNYDITYSGLYNVLEASGEALLTQTSGILNDQNNRIHDALKYDYIYRKHYNLIKYEE